MRSAPRRAFSIQGAAVLLLAVLAATARAAEDDSEITAVFATVHNGYTRTKLPDGTFATETYSFGEGGFTGTATKDKSVDEQDFRKIAGSIAPGLARQGYVASFDAEKTQLLVLVYWGTTGTDQDAAGGYDLGPAPITPPPPPPVTVSAGPGGATVSAPPAPVPTINSQQAAYDAMVSAQDRRRDKDNLRNAHILGFDEALAQTSSQPGSRRHQDLVSEIEDTRYFVVLRAFDFQALWKEKKHKLLWEVHYSLRARNHRFDQSLDAMTRLASRYFGQASGGLVRQEVPLGRVRLGDTIFKGESKPDQAEKK